MTTPSIDDRPRLVLRLPTRDECAGVLDDPATRVFLHQILDNALRHDPIDACADITMAACIIQSVLVRSGKAPAEWYDQMPHDVGDLLDAGDET